MKKDIKKLWVKALRSGKYKQGRGELKTVKGRYCCLGVLTDLYCKKYKKNFQETKKGHGELLSDKVQAWAGLRCPDATVETREGLMKNLSDLNDSGTRFKTIANYIEKQL